MKRLLPIAIFALSIIVASPAFAYIFDAMCAPKTDHSVATGPPQVLFVLDQSGSMSIDCCDIDGDGTDEDRWEVATTVIDEVSLETQNVGPCASFGDATCDLVNVGLGYFSSNRTLAVEPAEDTNSAISASLSAESPSGGTQIGQAASVLDDSTALDAANRINIGVIVSDGIPDDQFTTEQAVDTLCTLRDRAVAPVTTYSVGFGGAVASGRGKLILDFLAAAGGTGECCYQATWPCADAFKVDPCALTAAQLDSAIRDNGTDDSTYIFSDYECDGSLIATDGDGLKNELLTIAQNAACVFPLDIPAGYPAGTQAKDDPDATAVEFTHTTFGTISLPYCPDTDSDCGLEANLLAAGVNPPTAKEYEDEGWFWLDTQRTHVQLSPKLCDEVAADNVTKVETQVACLCSLEGQACIFTFNGTFTNEQVANARCSAGVYTCPDGSTDTCTSVLADMPEICNGVDDDCNGVVDDIEASIASGTYSGPAYDLPAGLEGIMCLGENACSCPGGYQDPKVGTTVVDFYNSWSGTCTCGNALETADDDPIAPADSQAACSFSQTPERHFSMIWLALLGLFWIPIGYEKLRQR